MHQVKKFLFLLLSLSALMLLPAMAPAFAQQAPVSASVAGNSFIPATVHVAPGTTVQWTNTGLTEHSVTADDGSFDSGMLAPGDSFSMTFTDPGVYQYYCQAHGEPGLQGMAATIVVDDAAPTVQQRTGDDYQPTETD